jgi:hypothetical protein
MLFSAFERQRFAAFLFCVTAICGLLNLTCSLPAAEKASSSTSTTEAASASEERLKRDVTILSADKMEGRGIGLKGLDDAAELVAAEFRKIGLKTDNFNDSPFQTFKVTASSKLGPDKNNVLQFVPTAAEDDSAAKKREPIVLNLRKDFTPLSLGGAGKLDFPLVFVGYGITAAKEKYDDYAGIDVKDKAVIILRHEPQQKNPHSVFNGTSDTPYAELTKKVSNAYQHGAAAVLFVSDDVDVQEKVKTVKTGLQETLEKLAVENEALKKIPIADATAIEEQRKKISKLLTQTIGFNNSLARERDELLPFQRGDVTDSRRLPIVHVKRAVIDNILKPALNTTLADLEKQIDKDLKPRSAAIPGWKVAGETDVVRIEAEIKNVIGVLEGDGPLADETIVVGAHYDHLGRGGRDSLARGSSDIHNGADDNASGTAALLEVAREVMKRGKQPRRIVFIAFSGEERGLLGSAYYVKHPLFPLNKTIAMLNMDMVGRLKDNKLIVSGYDTSKEFEALVKKLNEPYNFSIKLEQGGHGPSDHSSFYSEKIPVMHYFTGLHEDYHRPSDDIEKLDIHGMQRVAAFMVDTVIALAANKDKPTFQTAGSEPNLRKPGATGSRPYFGSIPDFANDVEGYALSGVTGGSPADRAGIKAGDVITALGENKVGSLADFDGAIRKFKAGDSVEVTIKRGTETLKLKVVVEPPK